MSNSRTPKPISNRSLTARLAALGFGMFLFGVFFLPPLYDVFCEITGLGGKTNQESATNVVVAADETRQLNLEFVTTVNQHAPWEFRAAVPSMTIHPGGLYEANFIAKNLTNKALIAQAVPSVAPAQAAAYFKKLDCFCFTAQEFSAGEEKDMLVRFLVDSDLPDYIDTITLSYTFFDATHMGKSTASGSSDHSGP